MPCPEIEKEGLFVYLELISPYIGTSSEVVPQKAEAGAIRKFAIASLETNLLYYDEEYAASTPYGGLIAPPTFMRTFYYPPVLPVEGKILPIRGRVHGSQRFEFFKPIRAGDTVYCRTTLISAREKQGSSGYLLFVTFEQAALDEHGEAYTLGYNTVVYKEALLRSTDPARFTTWFPMIPDDSWLRDLKCARPETVAAGDEIGPIALPEITRAWIAQWAGATNDFNPIHLDDRKASDAGMGGVIAHGMLSAGVASRIFGAWLGALGRQTDFTSKFCAPVRPGDRLTFRARVTEVERERGEVRAKWKYAIVNEDGVSVLEGSAAGVLG